MGERILNNVMRIGLILRTGIPPALPGCFACLGCLGCVLLLLSPGAAWSQGQGWAGPLKVRLFDRNYGDFGSEFERFMPNRCTYDVQSWVPGLVADTLAFDAAKGKKIPARGPTPNPARTAWRNGSIRRRPAWPPAESCPCKASGPRSGRPGPSTPRPSSPWTPSASSPTWEAPTIIPSAWRSTPVSRPGAARRSGSTATTTSGCTSTDA